MKIAVGILGIALGLLTLLQSCAVATTASIIDQHAAADAGSVGIIVGLLSLIGGAFAFGLPLVSAIVLALASLFAFAVSADFPDMRIWGFVNLVLAGLVFYVWKAARKKSAVKGPGAV